MPAILERLVKQLKADGKPASAAYAIAVSALQKSGNLKKGTLKATKKGAKRGRMSPAARAKDRAAKRAGTDPAGYVYDSTTNRATRAANTERR